MNIRKLVVCALCLVLLVFTFIALFPKEAQADEYWTHDVDADSYVLNTAPDSNFGSDNDLILGGEPADIYRFWLKFDLSSMPTGAVISEATVRFIIYYDDGTNDPTIAIHHSTNDSWTEGGITWNNDPSYNSTASDSELVTWLGQVTLDVTYHAQTEYAGDQTASFLVKVTNEGVDNDNAIRSRDYDGGSNAPWIQIIYTNPDPTNDYLGLVDPEFDTKGCLEDYRAYTFTSNVTDLSGGTDIDRIYLYWAADINLNWWIRWTEDTDTFYVSDPSDHITFYSDAADTTLDGYTWIIDWEILFKSSFPDQNQHDMGLQTFCDDVGYDADTWYDLYYVEKDDPEHSSLTLVDPSFGSQGVLSQYQAYTFRAVINYAVGDGSNMTYTDLTLDVGGEDLRFRWTQSTDTFTEEYDPFGYVTVSSDAADSTYASGQWTLDYEITFDWDYPDESLHTCRLYSLDDFSRSDQDDYTDLYRVENDLLGYDLDIDDTRVNPSQTSITFSGKLYYQGTSIYPADGNYHVQVRLSGVQKGSEDATLVSGSFSINDVQAEATVGLYNYTVEHDYMAWAEDFPDLIVDKIGVTIAANTTSPAINETVTFTVSAAYEYDSNPVTTLQFEVTRNSTYFSSSTPFYDVNSTYVLYNYTTSNANETTFVLNQFSTNTVFVGWGYTYTLFGAYEEVAGLRDGAMNVTIYKVGQAPEQHELDGEYPFYCAEYEGSVVEMDLGFNESRVYYLMYDSEDIYVFRPTQPYNYYYFTVVDFVGITNGYLETQINVNGTDYVVERWKLDILNDIPFTMSWGRSYQIVLKCDQGTYIFGFYVAGAKSTYTLPITYATFPDVADTAQGVFISASRTSATSIQTNYTDSNEQTNWVQVQIYQSLNNQLAYSTNNTGHSQQILWSSANGQADYYVKVTVNSSRFGIDVWIIQTPALFEGYENPWGSLSILGTFIIPVQYLVGFVVVLAFFSVFSTFSAPLAGIVGVIVAAILVVINWLNIPASWLAICMGMAILVAISIYRKRGERVV